VKRSSPAHPWPASFLFLSIPTLIAAIDAPAPLRCAHAATPPMCPATVATALTPISWTWATLLKILAFLVIGFAGLAHLVV